MMKMGVIKTIAHRRMMRMEVNSTTAWNSCAKGPSTIYACYLVKYTLYGYDLLVRISWVQRAMILLVGVLSSTRIVAPRTEVMS